MGSDVAGAAANEKATGSAATVSPARTEAVDLRVALALAFATGLLYSVGFSTRLWPVSLVALAPLAVALEGRFPCPCLLVGAVAGFTMNLLGMYWLYGTLTTFTGLPTVLCALVTLLLCAYQGGRFALFAWLYGRARQRGWSDVTAFLLSIVVSELTFPLLFPWYFAASVHDVPTLTQTAEFGGPYLVGVVLAAPSFAVAEVVIAHVWARSLRRWVVVAGLLTPIAAAIFGHVRLRQIDERVLAAEPVHVGLIQANLPLSGSLRDQVEAVRRHERMTGELRAKGVNFVVWSEAALRNVPHDDHVRQIERFATRLGVPSLVGALLTNREGRSFNVVFATNENGRVVGRYDKQHLLEFAERAPFGETFPIIRQWIPNLGRVVPGNSLDPLTISGHPVTVLICYEAIHPAFVNRAVNHARPELIVNATNDAWFGDTTEPWIHLSLAKLRAVEHRRYVVRATNSGVSAIIDPAGRVVAQSGTFREETVDAVVGFMKGPRTGYELWGDAPWWGASAVVLFMAFFRTQLLRVRPPQPSALQRIARQEERHEQDVR